VVLGIALTSVSMVSRSVSMFWKLAHAGLVTYCLIPALVNALRDSGTAGKGVRVMGMGLSYLGWVDFKQFASLG